MSTFHILNGDCLKDQFPFKLSDEELVVFREALVDGPVPLAFSEDFYQIRAEFFSTAYGREKEEYLEKVVPEFRKILKIPENAQIYLWFEDDLFCQINMWYCLNVLRSSNRNHELFWVRPYFENEYDWKGFGANSKEDLEQAFKQAEHIGSLQRGIVEDCLKLYLSNDVSKITHYIKSVRSIYKIYPLYADLLKAHLKRFSIPGHLSPLEKNVAALIKNGNDDFGATFKSFSESYGIYGFGDVQFKKIYDRVMEI